MNLINFINSTFVFLLPIIIPFMLSATALLFQKFKMSDMVRADYLVRSTAIGIFTNQVVFGLFSFDLWVIISFAQNTPVSYFFGVTDFSNKYAISLFALLLHLFTYIYTYSRELSDDFKNTLRYKERIGFERYFGRDLRYLFLLILSLMFCIIIRY